MAVLHGVIGFVLGVVVGLVIEIFYLRYKTAKHLETMQDEMGELMELTDDMETQAQDLATDDNDDT